MALRREEASSICFKNWQCSRTPSHHNRRVVKKRSEKKREREGYDGDEGLENSSKRVDNHCGECKLIK